YCCSIFAGVIAWVSRSHAAVIQTPPRSSPSVLTRPSRSVLRMISPLVFSRFSQEEPCHQPPHVKRPETPGNATRRGSEPPGHSKKCESGITHTRPLSSACSYFEVHAGGNRNEIAQPFC